MGSSSKNHATEIFVDHFKIIPQKHNQDLLWQIGEAFTNLPYENLTKLIKKHEYVEGELRRRLPNEVIGDHIEYGTGGTCFSLTNFFETILKDLGFNCFIVMCDMRNRPNSHCALVVQLEDGPYLMDPGYLLHRPVLIQKDKESKRNTNVAQVSLVPTSSPNMFDLFTGDKWRYQMKFFPVQQDCFVKLWEESFDWTMMNNVHLSRANDKGYTYVHGNKLRIQGTNNKKTINIRGEEEKTLAQRFGIDKKIINRAYSLIRDE